MFCRKGRMWAVVAVVWAAGKVVVPSHGFVLERFLRGEEASRGYYLSKSACAPLGCCSHRLPVIWIEDAEDGFVDQVENLEDGEICLKSLKSFASSHPRASENNNDADNDTESSSESRFLGAGALIQRSPFSLVCNAWTADSILTEGGPNLQFQGALKVLDALLLFQLQRYSDNPILALQTFVVKCGSLDSEYTCASYMAAIARGFRLLRDQVRIQSIFKASFYDNDLDGLVLAADDGKEIYRKLAFSQKQNEESLDDQKIASTIYSLLPDDDTLRRFTHKRYTSPI